MEMSDQDLVVLWVEVLIAPVILLVLTQFVQFRGWLKLPVCYNRTELKIMFRPIQVGLPKGVFEYGEALIGTTPLIILRNDMIDCVNRSNGGMLAVCAPFGHGKTTTVVGAALGRLDGMPKRVLCLAPGKGVGWYTRVKQLAGLPAGLNGFDGARRLIDAMLNGKVSTKLSKRLRFLDIDRVKDASDALLHEGLANYGVLVIEDYSPEELKDKDTETVEKLRGELQDQEAYWFLDKLAELAFQRFVVVVITTNCKNTLRLIHHGINGGHKAKAAPFCTFHAGNRGVATDDVEMSRDYRGMPWDTASRKELFSKKYVPFSRTSEGKNMVDDLSIGTVTIRESCQTLYFANGGTCAKLKPTVWDYVTDYIMDPFQRLICCQPACSLAIDCIDDDDNNLELGASTTRYGSMRDGSGVV
jgi:hypothetical protein